MKADLIQQYQDGYEWYPSKDSPVFKAFVVFCKSMSESVLAEVLDRRNHPVSSAGERFRPKMVVLEDVRDRVTAQKETLHEAQEEEGEPMPDDVREYIKHFANKITSKPGERSSLPPPTEETMEALSGE